MPNLNRPLSDIMSKCGMDLETELAYLRDRAKYYSEYPQSAEEFCELIDHLHILARSAQGEEE